jgi:hypothetical protein
MYNCVKWAVMTDKPLHIFSVFVLTQNILRDQKELINYEAMSVKYYDSVSVCLPWLSGKQLAFWQHRIMLLSVACSAVPHFSTLSHKRHNFF